MPEQDPILAEHWTPALEELARRTSHEVRNALNGVSVNLEVINSRMERAAGGGDPVAASVLPFVRSAAEQLDQLAGITDSFLSLVRSTSGGSLDLLPLVTHATSLARHMARSEGREVRFTAVEAGNGEVVTSAGCGVTRLLVVRLLLDALATRADIDVELVGDQAGPRLEIRKAGSGSFHAADLSVSLATAAAAEGVQVARNGAGWSVAFPAAAPRLT